MTLELPDWLATRIQNHAARDVCASSAEGAELRRLLYNHVERQLPHWVNVYRVEYTPEGSLYHLVASEPFPTRESAATSLLQVAPSFRGAGARAVEPFPGYDYLERSYRDKTRRKPGREALTS
jgi:hypothetical protein